MNKQYRIVWNESTATWVAVAEIARSHGKSKGAHTGAASRAVQLVLRPIAMALALWGGLTYAGPPVATQLPTGGRVVAGQAAILQASNAVLNVNQTSQSAVINWNTFNLGSAATVNYLQPNASAAVLNRVLDANPSQIYGRISAPGQVFFTNPSGMYFAPSASVDVGSFTATTHSIGTADFMAGNYRFTRDGATGAIVNEGHIQAALGGYVALLAPEVRNHGVVLAQMGAVALAAGEAYQLSIQGSRLASIEVTPATISTLVENGQAVLAPEGWIILSAKAAAQLEASVINTGQVSANSLVERGGRIVLESTGNVSAGGSIQANSAQGQGGSVTVTGEHITLPAGSDIQATGTTGGGTVLVGGDWQGSGSLPQATTVNMQAGASIDASATQNGDGGKVVLWSDVHRAEGQTAVHGRVRARGGVEGGHGGQIETSGHQLDIAGASVNAGADQGQGGLWLLDPSNYTIDATVASTIVSSLNTGTPVTVTTADNTASLGSSGGTSDAGWIKVTSSIAKTLGGDATLTLKAHSYIDLAASTSITSSTGKLNLVLWTNQGGYSTGAATGTVTLNSSSSITTNGGHLWIGGSATNGGSTTWNGLTVGDGSAGYSGTGNILGVTLYGAVSTGGGHVSINGRGDNTGSANSWTVGVLLESASSLSAGAGNVSITGTTSGDTALSEGIEMRGGPFTTTSGTFTVNGTASSNTYASGATYGVLTRNGGSTSSTSGAISITGSAAGSSATLADISNSIGSTSSAGGITFNGATITGSGALTATGSTVTFNASGSATYSGVIGGTSGVTKTGSGT